MHGNTCVAQTCGLQLCLAQRLHAYSNNLTLVLFVSSKVKRTLVRIARTARIASDFSILDIHSFLWDCAHLAASYVLDIGNADKDS